jgi:hypothetical protein
MKNIEEIRERNKVALSKYLEEIMPENEILDVYNTLCSWGFYSSRDSIVKAIASRFQVSIQIADHRLINLGFFMPRG